MTDRWDDAPVPAAVPVLPVSELARSVAWYGRLGFAVRALFEGSGYAILGFEGTELHLARFDDAPPPGSSFSGCYLRVVDADELHARWSALGAPIITPPADQPHGMREFATEDPDGNLWRVGSPLVVPARATSDRGGTDAGAEGASTDGGGGDGSGGAEAASAETDWYAVVAGDDACPGCGFRVADTPARALGATVREEVHAFGLLLTAADDDALRRRPTPDAWSPLEYAVHVRDVLRLFGDRVVRTLRQDVPELGWWDHEAAIADGLANESDVSAVVDDLARNSSHLSEALRAVSEDDFARAATRRGVEPFTIELLGRFALHEVVHHRVDAERGLAPATPTS